MIYHSPYPDIAIPNCSITSFVLANAERHPDKLALVDGLSGHALSYRQLGNGIRRTASGLAARGFGKGDVFATVCPSVPEFALAFYAVAALGGATTMLNPLFTPAEMAKQLADAGARFILTVPERVAAVREASGGRNTEIFVIGESPEATTFASLQADAGPFPEVGIAPTKDVALLPYSSGTTGRPKGVMLTHSNLIASVLQWRAMDPIRESDVEVTVYPVFHIGGVITMNVFLRSGATVVTVPRYDFRSFLAALQNHGATRATLTPPVILDLVRQPVVDDYDLSRLDVIHWSAAPMSEELAQRCRERLGCRVKQIYAMTEAVPMHFVPTASQDTPGSAGPLVPNTSGKVLEPITGSELGVGETGEIWVRGPQVMQGYRGQPEATAQTLDAAGWLRTGDLGFVDPDGWIHIVDRVKELIKYKGYQVAPAELEAVLLSHPAVADAAVIPSPDEEAGEVPKAFVLLNQPVDADELLAFVAARVAPYKKVRRLEFIDVIPKSASGKILRRVLVERERAALPVLV